ncbi:hypothetical protein Vadar_033569 [Vaccinium darrowii]|uniref:Uncharacterized protein n=1 Tax=Vaccinium darrowii TaxID=229202 RepID=A0ACB7X6G5_9ERIC|nr:hypothetical protein Vadar_033569 [Vaccinium darrowii]
MANLGPDTEIRCPCIDCLNCKKLSSVVVKTHLIRRGIDPSYKTWVHHGEPIPVHEHQIQNDDNHEHNEVPEDDNHLQDMLEQIYLGGICDDDIDELPVNHERIDMHNFDKLFNAAQRKAYPGCEKTVLGFIVKMLHVKVYKKMSNDAFNLIMQIIKEMLLAECHETIPWTIYETKKLLRDLGLGYVPIHACRQYFYKKTAPDMTWHKNKRVDDGELRHPADGQEWKDFDERFPDFAADPRNVRLGMATDGFNPFGNMSQSYSMWPVFMVPYNLPPWKCMKEPFCFMSLLIPGPSAIGRDIDVYLRPLIDELKELWENGVQTYDSSTGQTFTMRACVLWTINDFPAYGIMSGWSTKGYLTCPICNWDIISVSLRSKIGYLGARHYLPEHHVWRRSKLFNGKMRIEPDLWSCREKKYWNKLI